MPFHRNLDTIERDADMLLDRLEGATVAQLARRFDLSHQRVSQILRLGEDRMAYFLGRHYAKLMADPQARARAVRMNRRELAAWRRELDTTRYADALSMSACRRSASA